MGTSNGPRKRTKKKFSQKVGYRPTLTKFLAEYIVGQQVVIMQEASSHRGVPFRRFRGTSGYIVGRRGNAYIIEIQDGNSVKKVISRPEHIKAITQGVVKTVTQVVK